ETIGISGPKVLAAGALMRAYKIATAAQEAALAEFELSSQRYEVLARLYFRGTEGAPLSEIGRPTLINPATMTYTADYLESRGLIRRELDPKDRRIIRAKITTDGRRLALAASQ